jgi:mono/diheme cytochrome c family protein
MTQRQQGAFGKLMIKGILVGFVLGVAVIIATVYLYFATGRVPVAVTAPEMPFERKLAHMAIHAYLEKLPHPDPPVPADESNLREGAIVYVKHCAVCHGLPGANRTVIADGMAPRPPQLLKTTGGTDDEPWENYWIVENGVRMTGMPGFKNRLIETQIWQVSLLIKNAGTISPTVRQILTDGPQVETEPDSSSLQSAN